MAPRFVYYPVLYSASGTLSHCRTLSNQLFRTQPKFTIDYLNRAMNVIANVTTISTAAVIRVNAVSKLNSAVSG